MEFDEIKAKLKAAGSVDAKNELIKKWMEEFDAREKGPLYHIIETKLQILQQQRIIDLQTEIIQDANKILEAIKLKTSSVPVVDDQTAPVPAD